METIIKKTGQAGTGRRDAGIVLYCPQTCLINLVSEMTRRIESMLELTSQHSLLSRHLLFLLSLGPVQLVLRTR